jgi:hypothetical protein
LKLFVTQGANTKNERRQACKRALAAVDFLLTPEKNGDGDTTEDPRKKSLKVATQMSVNALYAQPGSMWKNSASAHSAKEGLSGSMTNSFTTKDGDRRPSGLWPKEVLYSPLYRLSAHRRKTTEKAPLGSVGLFAALQRQRGLKAS